ncbi:MAG: ABC transporter ATP-binding protein [Spirochaetes bacterium]|nr:ABC transporter ATP-binding protein [Spirochaetota bacterium]
MAEIRLIGIQKKFDGPLVIDDLDLVIGDGEFFTIVGPSGCGKSTILNMIAGLDPVTRGSIFFDDCMVNDISPKERDVAMVFQNYALYPHMTVYENIAFPLRIKKMPKTAIDAEVRQVAALLDLNDFLRRRPRELSGGQRQRVALGRAMVRKPRVFLMDEPLSNLDAQLRIAMRSELKKLHEKLKITTVYVTHDQSEALGISDRIAVLHRGRIQQCDTPHDVYNRPANTFVAGFIGSPQMNFIHGSVSVDRRHEIQCNEIALTTVQDLSRAAGNVTIGLRPDDITVSSVEMRSGMQVEITVVEPAGAFCWVDFKWGGIEMRGKADSEIELRKGVTAYITFPVEKIHVFDLESGARIE